MGQPSAIFGKFLVRSTPDLVRAMRAGAVDEVHRTLIREALRKGGVEDDSLFVALDLADGGESAAKLLEELGRNNYWERARGHLTAGAIRFAPSEEVAAALTEALIERRSSAVLFAGGGGAVIKASGDKAVTGSGKNWKWLEGFVPEAREEVRKLFEEFSDENFRKGLSQLGRLALEEGFPLQRPNRFLREAIERFGIEEIANILWGVTKMTGIRKIKVPKELLWRWVNSWLGLSIRRSDDEDTALSLIHWKSNFEIDDELEGEILLGMIDRWKNKIHPIVNHEIENVAFVWKRLLRQEEEILQVMDELNFLFRRLEEFGIKPMEVQQVKDHIAEFYKFDPSIGTKDHPLRLLAIAAKEAKSKDQMEAFLAMPAGSLRRHFREAKPPSWANLFSSNPTQIKRMVLVEKENPQDKNYPYRRLVELAHEGPEDYRHYLDSLPQNKFVAERLRQFDIDPAQHRAGIGEKVVVGKGEVLPAEKQHEMKTQKTIGAWKILMEEKVLKKPERLQTKLKDTVFKGEKVAIADPESLQSALINKPEKLKPFIQTVIEFASRKDNVANPTRTNEALLILRRLIHAESGQAEEGTKNVEISVRFVVEKKHPVDDLTIGNDGACCIGVYLQGGEGEEEELSNGIYMPFYLSDDATHFVGIYLGKRRVGMALVFDGLLANKPTMLINSIELGKEFEEGDPRVSVVVRGVHEYMEAWAKRDRMVLLESAHDYNTGYLYEKNRGEPVDEEGFEKFHKVGQFYSDALDGNGVSHGEIRLLYDPSQEVRKVSKETASIDELIEAEDWAEVKTRLGKMVALQRQYAKDKAKADETFLQSMQAKARKMVDARKASEFLKIVLEVLDLN